MPADRRFESPEPKNDRTDLEVWLRVKGPELLRQNAANILLAVAVLIALGFFLYNRAQGKRAEALIVQQNSAAAYDTATQLRGAMTGVTSDAAARDRQQRARDAISYADVVINSDAATPAQKAIALLAKGDVYWALANAPAAALATSQPVASFPVKAGDAYLDDAAAAYTEILGKYENEPEPVASALLSLAAIAENRGTFDGPNGAASWYQRAIDEQSIRPAYRDVAKARLAMLADLRKPVTLASTQPAAAPATAPLIFRPAAPTTAPAAPTTAPAAPTAAATTTPAAPATQP